MIPRHTFVIPSMHANRLRCSRLTRISIRGFPFPNMHRSTTSGLGQPSFVHPYSSKAFSLKHTTQKPFSLVDNAADSALVLDLATRADGDQTSKVTHTLHFSSYICSKTYGGILVYENFTVARLSWSAHFVNRTGGFDVKTMACAKLGRPSQPQKTHRLP